MRFPLFSPAEAAALVRHGQTVGFGGFTTAGTPKSIGAALAAQAAAEHAAGRPFALRVNGVAVGPVMDGALAPATASRTPYQSNPAMRAHINSGACAFFDMHLSHVTQAVRYGFLGPLHWAIIEAADVTAEGEILLTSAVGASPTFCNRADKILIELNQRQPAALRGMHDIYEPADPPHRREIPVYRPSDRIGAPVILADQAKIAGIVEVENDDDGTTFEEPTPLTSRIGENVAAFLAREIAAGRVPPSFLPIQSGVGDIANGVLAALGAHPDIPPFNMYTEVIQDAVVRLMESGRVPFASCCSLSVSREALRHVYANLAWFRERVVMRPQEITNHPEVVRRLGVVSINTALEADIFGNVNSTHLMGRRMMNGIGGSGDFTRNAYISIFTCPSTAKDGKISTIVPMVTHLDHSEHSVQVIATEWGVADLRGRSPRERARAIIRNCAHPDFRDALESYVGLAEAGHTPHTLSEAFSFHERYGRAGDMRPGQAASL